MIRDATTPLQRVCDQCGAQVRPDASCVERFDALLALDHSRAEPWGSRHGLAFAVFTLQHSRNVSAETVERCREMLHRVYVLGEDRMHVANSFRRKAHSADISVPRLGAGHCIPNIFAFTIDDMGDFAAETYVVKLDAWCRATLAAWSQ